jgi:hypothetical protein
MTTITDPPELRGLDSMLVDLYFAEAWSLAISVREQCERVFDLAKNSVEAGGAYMAINPEVHKIIALCLSDAANLKKLFRTSSNRGEKETKRSFDLRCYRAQMLSDLLSGIPFKELTNARLRNTIEHFDEYLDSAVLALSDKQSRKSPWAGYNLVVSSLAVHDPPVHPIRVYSADDRTYHNFRWSIDLDLLYKEAAAAEAVLRTHPRNSHVQSPGGAILSFEA